MKINENLNVTITRKGEVWVKENKNAWHIETDPNLCNMYKKLRRATKRHDIAYIDAYIKQIESEKIRNKVNIDTSDMNNMTDTNMLSNETKVTVIQNIINFFSEFEYEPNFRFINTFARHNTSAKQYILNYFKLTNTIDILNLTEKMKSPEFSEIVNALKDIKTSKQINTRLSVYYGSAGTGKTTQALKETNGVCMVCHSAMLPNDLMEDFKFENGQPTFQPSALQKAMVNGTAITLDEMNLLPFESLRFLQSILDDKQQIEWKGATIKISNGFKIIGTMNLVVNGCTYNLPEPLVDRCSEIKEFKLTAKNLLGAL